MHRLIEIFGAFLFLGMTSFGGPIAHLGYFREEFVARRKWLSESAFAELVSICQFLPGPTSSQVGFLIGLQRGGYWGALAAFVAFTLPSAILMMLAAYGVAISDGPYRDIIIHGLKIVAVIIVAQAVVGMARTLTPDLITRMIAILSALFVVLSVQQHDQIAAIATGAILGMLLCRGVVQMQNSTLNLPVSEVAGFVCLGALAVIFVSLPYLAAQFSTFEFISKFFYPGALVFGGGHVVLPLLEQEFVSSGDIDKHMFVAGYGAAQAVPGPLFTFASYLGVLAGQGGGGAIGAFTALGAIFLPGFLILVGIVPFWARLKRIDLSNAALRGASAAVVGILGAALYDPILTSSISHPVDIALVIMGYAFMIHWRLPSWAIVLMIPSLFIVLQVLGLYSV